MLHEQSLFPPIVDSSCVNFLFSLLFYQTYDTYEQRMYFSPIVETVQLSSHRTLQTELTAEKENLSFIRLEQLQGVMKQSIKHAGKFWHRCNFDSISGVMLPVNCWIDFWSHPWVLSYRTQLLFASLFPPWSCGAGSLPPAASSTESLFQTSTPGCQREPHAALILNSSPPAWHEVSLLLSSCSLCVCLGLRRGKTLGWRGQSDSTRGEEAD